MTLAVNDFMESVSEFVQNGYDREYRLKDGQLVDLALSSPLSPSNLRVDATLRFESGDEAGDASHVLAISDRKSDRKGLLIEAFDVFDQLRRQEAATRLADAGNALVGAHDVPTRNGLRKIYKSEFDEDRERYVLRIGYPDFPKCRSGGTGTVLGFDTAEQVYVWLVPSIIRDPQLARIPYPGELATNDEN